MPLEVLEQSQRVATEVSELPEQAERGQMTHVAELRQRLRRVAGAQALGHHRAPVERHPDRGELAWRCVGLTTSGALGPGAPERQPQLRV